MLDLTDRLDICQAMYGRLRKAGGCFYWANDKSALVDIRTGEDMTSHFEKTLGLCDRWLINKYVSFKRNIIAIVNEKKQTVLYNNAGDVVMILDWIFQSQYFREILIDKHRRSIIMLDSVSAYRDKRVILFDNITGQIIEYREDIKRAFVEEDCVKLVVFQDGDFRVLKYTYE